MDLYRRVPPLGYIIPINTAPFSIDDSIPFMGKIEWAVRLLHIHLSWGASGMREDHLNYWLAEVTWKERPDTANWDRLVKIIQVVLGYGRLPKECTWQMVLLITKGDGGFR